MLEKLIKNIESPAPQNQKVKGESPVSELMNLPEPKVYCPFSKVEKKKILSGLTTQVPPSKILEIISDDVLSSQSGWSLKSRSENLGVSVKQLTRIYKHFKINK